MLKVYTDFDLYHKVHCKFTLTKHSDPGTLRKSAENTM